MKKIILLLLLYTSCVQFCFSQSSLPKNVSDSLWGVWTNAALHDTVRLGAIQRYGWDGYSNTMIDSAVYFASLQYAFAKQANHPRFVRMAANTMGNVLYLKGAYQEAIVFYDEALQLAQQRGEKKS